MSSGSHWSQITFSSEAMSSLPFSPFVRPMYSGLMPTWSRAARNVPFFCSRYSRNGTVSRSKPCARLNWEGRRGE
eukprot:957100-Pyramimonas_sp.AAC.1